MSLIGLLVAAILIGLLFWALRAIMGAFAIPAQIQTVVTVLFVVIVVLWIVQQLGVFDGGPILRLR